MKIAYKITKKDSDENSCWGYVAESAEQALDMAWRGGDFDDCEEKSELECSIAYLGKSSERVNVEDQPIGLIDYIVGLKRGLYYSIWEECEVCGGESEYITFFQKKLMCEDCRETAEEVEKNNAKNENIF